MFILIVYWYSKCLYHRSNYYIVLICLHVPGPKINQSHISKISSTCSTRHALRFVFCDYFEPPLADFGR